MALGSNLAAILVTEYFVAGFKVTHDLVGLAIVVVIFMVANSIILPVVRTILKPLIWLTAGLLAVVINGTLIYFVDKLSDGITISGFSALLWATLIMGVVNATVSYGAKILKLGHD